MAQVNGSSFGSVSWQTVTASSGYAYITYTTTTSYTAVSVSVSLSVYRHANRPSVSAGTGGSSLGFSYSGSVTGTSTSSGTGTISFVYPGTQHGSQDKRATLVSSASYSYPRGTSAQTKTISFSVTETCSQTSGTKTSSGSITISVPALDKFTISYSNNGGQGSIASQTKTYSVGGVYFSNGSGFSKYGTLSGTGAKTRAKLLSWNTAAGGGGTTYQLGAAVPEITSNLTLYAQWQNDYYIYPTLSNVKAIRTKTNGNSDTDENDLGEYLYISFNWTGYSVNGGSTMSAPTCKIYINGTVVNQPTLSGSSGTYTYRPSSTYSNDQSWAITIELYYSSDTTMRADYHSVIGTAILPIDLYGYTDNNHVSHVYMGIMKAYVEGQTVTMPDIVADSIGLTLDANAGSGTDYDIRTAISALGWSGCIEQ